MMRFMLLLIAVFAGIPLTFAAGQPRPTGGIQEIYTGTVLSVIDARTLRIAKDGGGEIRVRRLVSHQRDTRQTADPEAQGGLTDLMLGHQVQVKTVRWERGILLGHLSIEDGENGTSPLHATGSHSESPKLPAIERPSAPQRQVPPAGRSGEVQS